MAMSARIRLVGLGALTVYLVACQIEAPPLPVMPMGIGTTSTAPSVLSLRAIQSQLVMAVGEEKDLLPYVRTVGDGSVPTMQLDWVLSNPSLMTVDAKTGRAKAVGKGSVVLTVRVPGSDQGAAQLIVEVTDVSTVKEISVAPAEQHMVVGDRVKLVPQVKLPNGEINANVLWSSSDDTVATINPTTGEATALKVGRVTMVAAYALDPRFKGLADLIIYKDRSDIPSSQSPATTVAASTKVPPASPGRLSPSSRPSVTASFPASLSPSPVAPVTSSASPAIQSPTPVVPTPTSKPTSPPVSAAPVSAQPTPAATSFSVGSDPFVVAIDGVGNLWVAPTNNSDNVTKLSPAGVKIGAYAVGSLSEGIVVDGDENVWVTHNTASNSVTKLSPAGATIGVFAAGSYSRGIAIDPAGNVWVANFAADLPSGSVTKLSPAGAKLGTFSAGVRPNGIALDASGNAWVTDISSSGNVTKLSPAGAVLGTYAVGRYPQGIAIDSTGNAWVANEGSSSVTKLSSVGATLGTYVVGGQPRHVAIDGEGNVWVTNSISSGSVTKLSPAGAVLGTYPVGSYPVGIAIDGVGNVWVANLGDGTLTKLSKQQN